MNPWALSPAHVWRTVALGSYAALLFASAPAWPDDWDGVGFVESLGDFDLAHFHPHPPGYPVYVALLRMAASFARVPMRACILVAVVSGVVAIALAWDAARRTVGERAAWPATILMGATPAVWRACSGVGSEAPALAFAAACAWGLVVSHRRAVVPDPIASRMRPPTSGWLRRTLLGGWNGATVLGLGAGLGLGVRLSWGPLYLAALALAPRGQRGRAWGTAAVACLAWAAPFFSYVGLAKVAGIYASHFSGHTQRWGGTIVTEPGPTRLVWLGRDLLVDGLGVAADWLGLAIGLLLAVAMVLALVAWRRAHWAGWREAVVLVMPYLVWIALGQNLREQPRHAVPLVALLAAILGIPAAPSRAAAVFAGALAVAVSTRAATDAHARRTIPPPGQQLVELARVQPTPARLAVFGGASVRFFETTELASRALAAGSLGDVMMELTSMDELPTRVWVTSELGDRNAGRWPLTLMTSLCRPARLDRRMPCLGVYAWELPFLPTK